MIPSEFEYHRPSDIQSVLQLLQSHGDEARVLAGGHSLVPAMKMRLTGLSHLIDLQDIGDLKGISIGSDDVTIGAMTTQHDVITDEALARTIPIIREAATQIADPQVRYVGTVGGNIANGDPANDMPGLMQCLGARFELIGPGGTRVVPAGAYYHSAYVTERADDEVLTRIAIPKPAAGMGYAYEKQKRKIGDYATAAAAVLVGNGKASIAMTNLADTPIWSEAASLALANGDRNGAIAAAMAAISPVADQKGPVEFKMHAAKIVLGRAIDRALSRAG